MNYSNHLAILPLIVLLWHCKPKTRAPLIPHVFMVANLLPEVTLFCILGPRPLSRTNSPKLVYMLIKLAAFFAPYRHVALLLSCVGVKIDNGAYVSLAYTTWRISLELGAFFFPRLYLLRQAMDVSLGWSTAVMDIIRRSLVQEFQV